MRVLVLSDIHANAAALEAVLADARARAPYDFVWCLGDVVGYGPDPNECIDILRGELHVCLAGNHDWAVLGKLDLQTFHDSAAMIVQWTRSALSPRNRAYLEARPPQEPQADFYLVHASPREPIWEYITDVVIAEENFQLFDTPYCLCGHTHVPAVFVLDERTRHVRISWPAPSVPFKLRPETRYILNPGGVGQPRDGDPRAAYAILDTVSHMWTLHRVDYPIQVTQDRMRQCAFPDRMVERLAYGR